MKYYSYALNVLLLWVIFKMYGYYNDHYKKIDDYNFFGVNIPTTGIGTNVPVITVVTPTENTKEEEKKEDNEKGSLVEEQYLESIIENGSDEYEDSKLSPSDYYNRKANIIKILTKNFSIDHLKCINAIYLIDWESMEDNTSAITVGMDDSYENSIYITTDNNGYYKSSILHEVWHCIHNSHMSLFRERYKEKWEHMNRYVSDYAQTNISEDIAETGMFYCGGNIDNRNGKFGLIEQFYEDTR